jgi:hypothetical protein
MNSNDLIILLGVIAAGTAALAVFIIVRGSALGFLKRPNPNRQRFHSLAPGWAEKPGTASLRKGFESIPTVTCALPAAVAPRPKERLW